MNGRLIIFVFSVLCCIGSVRADEFLSKSEILRIEGIAVVPVQRLTPDSVILPSEYDSSSNAYFLSESGEQIALKNTGKDHELSWMSCGDPVKGPVFKSAHGQHLSGLFAAIGEKAASVKFKWRPAKRTKAESNTGCIFYKKGFLRTQLDIRRVSTLQGKVFFAEWKNPADTSQRTEYTNTDGTKISECVVEDARFQRLGLLSSDGKCRTIFESPINCDGQGYQEGTLDALEGTVEVIKGAKKELWLVFHAHGYEGQAYLGVRADHGFPAKDNDVQLYVYSGC